MIHSGSLMQSLPMYPKTYRGAGSTKIVFFSIFHGATVIYVYAAKYIQFWKSWVYGGDHVGTFEAPPNSEKR